MCRIWLVLFMLIGLPLWCLGQTDKIVVRFADGNTGNGIARVRVIGKGNILVGITDTGGYVLLPLSILDEPEPAIAVAVGYSPDTLRVLRRTMYLNPLQVTLPAAVISGKPLRRLIDAVSDYVIDYTFTGDKLLAATTRGNGKYRLVLMDVYGTESGSLSIPVEPTAMFTSCLGNCYCVCGAVFYLVDVSGAVPRLVKQYPAELVAGLQQCEDTIGDYQYFRMTDNMGFRTVYGSVDAQDSTFRPFCKIELKGVAQASFEELMEALILYESGQFKAGSLMYARKKLWDKESLLHISNPILKTGDTLFVLDYGAQKLKGYNPNGTPCTEVALGLERKRLQRYKFLKDPVARRVYVHEFSPGNVQTVQLLDVAHGVCSGSVTPVAKPYAERVCVHNGMLYFLWQDGAHGGTRQLYVQQML